MDTPRMRKIGKGVNFRRNNISFHTRHEKLVWSIILTGTHQRRVITSFVCTSCGPVEDLIPRGVCGMCDAISALSSFIIWRQRWLSWVFVVGTIKRGNSCYHNDLISCEFHVCAAVPLPFPPCSSLLFTLNHCYPLLTTKGEEKGDILCSRTSSLLSQCIDQTFSFAILIHFFYLIQKIPKDSGHRERT